MKHLQWKIIIIISCKVLELLLWVSDALCGDAVILIRELVARSKANLQSQPFLTFIIKCLSIYKKRILIVPINAVKAACKSYFFNVNLCNCILKRIIFCKVFICTFVVGYLTISKLFKINFSISPDYHFNITRIKLRLVCVLIFFIIINPLAKRKGWHKITSI